MKLQLINSLGSGFSRGDYFLFGLIFTYKNNQIKILKNTKKKNQNRFKPTGFGSVWLSCFRTKTETQLTGFGSVRLFYIKNQKLYFFLGFFCNF